MNVITLVQKKVTSLPLVEGRYGSEPSLFEPDELGRGPSGDTQPSPCDLFKAYVSKSNNY